MNQTLTTVLAVWGAVLSTFAIGWQIFLWRRANPHVLAKATMKESLSGDSADDWIVFELRNRGGKPTTIEEIHFVAYENWFDQVLRHPNNVENLSAYRPTEIKLPAILHPGELWKGNCYLGPRDEDPHLDSTRRKRFVAGKLFFRIKCAHTDRTINGTVKPEPFSERL